MQSKVILTVTGILILLPALFYYFVEFSPADWPEMTASERIWASLFQTVTPRTAGFNTVDLTQISQAGLMIMILLMLIGGATGIDGRRHQNHDGGGTLRVRRIGIPQTGGGKLFRKAHRG